MIECLWALFLAVAMADRQARPLAFLLTIKWACSYAAFYVGADRALVLIDVVAGIIGCGWLGNIPATRRAVIASTFVVTPLIHGAYWIIADAGGANYAIRVIHYTLLAMTFTAQLVALSGPGVIRLVGIFLDLTSRSSRVLFGRVAPVPRQRPRPSRQ